MSLYFVNFLGDFFLDNWFAADYIGGVKDSPILHIPENVHKKAKETSFKY